MVQSTANRIAVYRTPPVAVLPPPAVAAMAFSQGIISIARGVVVNDFLESVRRQISQVTHAEIHLSPACKDLPGRVDAAYGPAAPSAQVAISHGAAVLMKPLPGNKWSYREAPAIFLPYIPQLHQEIPVLFSV